MTDFDGRLIHTFSHNQDGKLVELDSFTMHPNTIIGACNAVYGIFNTGTWSSILMTDFDGRLLHTFSHNQDGKLVELDSFTVLPNNEVLYDFWGTVKAASHECLIRAGQS